MGETGSVRPKSKATIIYVNISYEVHKRYTKFHKASSISFSIDNFNEHWPTIWTQSTGRWYLTSLARHLPECPILARIKGEKHEDYMRITWELHRDCVECIKSGNTVGRAVK